MSKSTPETARDLFEVLRKECHGAPYDVVIQAALNLVINGIRQQHGNWSAAERAYDETMARTKGVLRDHYDPIGKRRSVFPFTQVLSVPHVSFRKSKGGSY